MAGPEEAAKGEAQVRQTQGLPYLCCFPPSDNAQPLNPDLDLGSSHLPAVQQRLPGPAAVQPKRAHSRIQVPTHLRPAHVTGLGLVLDLIWAYVALHL